MFSQNDYWKCKKCGNQYESKLKAEFEWCRPCLVNNLEKNFTNWTSGNKEIDHFIQTIQLSPTEPDTHDLTFKRNAIFEWIPYNQFNDIKEISDDFSTVYSAIWKDGP